MSPPTTRSSGTDKTPEANHSGPPEHNALQTTGTMESPDGLAEANHSGSRDQNAPQAADHIIGTGVLADMIGTPPEDIPLPTLPSLNLDLTQETSLHDEDPETLENWSSKRILGKLIHNQFIIMDKLTKIEKTLDEQTKKDNELQPIQKELEHMKELLQNSINTRINREGRNNPQQSQSTTLIQRDIHTLIETETREIGKQIWEKMSHERQKQTYENWLEMKPPVIPKKYQPTNNPLETEIERDIRIEMAIERVKGDIRLYDIRIQKAQKRIEDIQKHVETEISKQPEDQRKEINLRWNSAIQQETDRAEHSWEKRKSFLKNHSDNYQGPFKETRKTAQRKNGAPTHGQIGYTQRFFQATPTTPVALQRTGYKREYPPDPTHSGMEKTQAGPPEKPPHSKQRGILQRLPSPFPPC